MDYHYDDMNDAYYDDDDNDNDDDRQDKLGKSGQMLRDLTRSLVKL